MDKVTIQRCCLLCEYIYDKEKCPLHDVYKTANDCGDSTFDDYAKYRVACDAFLLLKKLKL